MAFESLAVSSAFDTERIGRLDSRIFAKLAEDKVAESLAISFS